MFTTLYRSLPSIVSRPITLALAVAALSAMTITRPAQAQSSFDRDFNRQLNQLMARNNDGMEQLWQYHLQVNGPRLRAQYRQFCASGNNPGLSFQQFAHNDLMSAGGTDWAGARRAQLDQFDGQQVAQRTRIEAGEARIAAMRANSDRAIAATENYANRSIRGLSPYIDPNTGATRMLPHSLAAGQTYNDGRTIYTRDASGTFSQRTGSGWQAMNAGR